MARKKSNNNRELARRIRTDKPVFSEMPMGPGGIGKAVRAGKKLVDTARAIKPHKPVSKPDPGAASGLVREHSMLSRLAHAARKEGKEKLAQSYERGMEAVKRSYQGINRPSPMPEHHINPPRLPRPKRGK